MGGGGNFLLSRGDGMVWNIYKGGEGVKLAAGDLLQGTTSGCVCVCAAAKVINTRCIYGPIDSII